MPRRTDIVAACLSSGLSFVDNDVTPLGPLGELPTLVPTGPNRTIEINIYLKLKGSFGTHFFEAWFVQASGLSHRIASKSVVKAVDPDALWTWGWTLPVDRPRPGRNGIQVRLDGDPIVTLAFEVASLSKREVAGH